MKDDDYLSADTTQKLLSRGYNGRVDTIYNKDRTHFYEAAKWLRNKHHLHVCVDCVIDIGLENRWYFSVSDETAILPMGDDRTYNTYEEALTHGIEAALKLITD